MSEGEALKPAGLSALTALHARRLLRAREHETAAARLRAAEPERAELCADQARLARAEAAALAELLEPHGVHVAPEGQLALWNDGGAR